jgi:hypothetical protein
MEKLGISIGMNIPQRNFPRISPSFHNNSIGLVTARTDVTINVVPEVPDTETTLID